MSTRGCLYLQVPYADRMEAKAAGLSWDKNHKLWYLPSWAYSNFSAMKQEWIPAAISGYIRYAQSIRILSSSLFASLAYGQNEEEKTRAANAVCFATYNDPSVFLIEKWMKHFQTLYEKLRLFYRETLLKRPVYVPIASDESDECMASMKTTFWYISVRKDELTINDNLVHIYRGFGTTCPTNRHRLHKEDYVLLLTLISKCNDDYITLKESAEWNKENGELLLEEFWNEYHHAGYEIMAETQSESDGRTDLHRLRDQIDIHTSFPYDLVDLIFSYITKEKIVCAEPASEEKKEDAEDLDSDEIEPLAKLRRTEQRGECDGKGRCLRDGNRLQAALWLTCVHRCYRRPCRVCLKNYPQWVLEENGGTCDDCTFEKLQPHPREDPDKMEEVQSSTSTSSSSSSYKQ